ncbi:MAG: adenylate/guanylate cyclase domain-containing protein [Cyanobacteria bacterium]|nr:adenylate/guanylate cyclase domain-containing protein [Cyanobacteriota bacterium]MDA0865936.1 adenylate/guanylate cyclase domain-containing protein [Cyanobacteriota bacterium]
MAFQHHHSRGLSGRGLGSILWIGLGSTLVAIALWLLGAWEPLERSAYTLLFQARARLSDHTWDDRLAVIAIDEPSLERYGRYPLPRDLYASLLDTLLPVQPAAIGFDMLFPEATAEDGAFADSIALSGNVVLAVGDNGQGQAIENSLSLTQGAEGSFLLGSVKHTVDSDGLSRRIWLYEGRFPSFGISLLEMYRTSLENTLGIEEDPLPDLNAAVFEQPQQFNRRDLWVNWPGPIEEMSAESGLQVFSLVDVLEERVDISALQNKIVVVGVTATAVDPLRTPFHKTIPTAGLYLHAAVIDNLLADAFITRAPLWAVIVLLLGSGVGGSLLLKNLSMRGRIAILAGMTPIWFAVAYGSFLGQVWLPVVAPLGTTFISALGLQLIEQRERQALMDLFAINLSSEMADLLWQHRGEILKEGAIQPQELMATVLFTDIRGFTTISENLPSADLLAWLNRYFEVMTTCIMDNGGVVDKYIGDAIMASFGAPLARPGTDAWQQDAIAAVTAALAMHERLQSLNQEFRAANLPTVEFGVGIHTGPVIVGTVGSRQRLSYSLFGDTVNIAARLQDMTKTLTQKAPYPILLSQYTYEQMGDRYEVSPMGEIQLRGRTEKTIVYTPTSTLAMMHKLPSA